MLIGTEVNKVFLTLFLLLILYSEFLIVVSLSNKLFL